MPPPPPKRSRVELGMVPKASFAQGLTGKASSKKMPESKKMASQSLTETSASQSREAHGICPSDRAPAGMPRRFHDHDVMGGVKRPRPQETDPKGQALPALKTQARANTREAAAASSSSAPAAKETESADQRPFVTRAAPVPQSTTLAEPLRYLTGADRITGVANGQLRYFRFAGAQMLSPRPDATRAPKCLSRYYTSWAYSHSTRGDAQIQWPPRGTSGIPQPSLRRGKVLSRARRKHWDLVHIP